MSNQILPIRMLRDEENNLFVPFTNIKAVSGLNYVLGILPTTKDYHSIIDKTLAVDNRYVYYVNENETDEIVNSDSFWTTGKIPVTPNTTYEFLYNSTYVVYYGQNGRAIGGEYNKTSITTNEYQYFIQLSFSKSIVAFNEDVMVSTEGFFTINNEDLTKDSLIGRMIAVNFENIGIIENGYLRLNEEEYLPIYSQDGNAPLAMKGLDGTTLLLELFKDKWQVVKIGGAGGTGGGHFITDSNDTIMTQRSVLNFYGAKVEDLPGIGATRVTTSWISNNIPTITGQISNSNWTKLLESDIIIPEEGYYRIMVHLDLANLSTVNKEIGVRLLKGSDVLDESWKIQYKRLKDTYILVGQFDKDDLINPEIYIDNITSTDNSILNNGKVYIEYLNNINI